FNGLSLSNVSIRRNVITDAWSTSKGQGVYAAGIDGLLIEQNVLDHNGWNSSISGAVPSVYSHNLYLSARDTGVIVRGNIIANAAIQLNIGSGVTNPTEVTGINDLTIEHNFIRKWFSSAWSTSNFTDGASGANGLNALTVRNNDFQVVNGTNEITHGQAYRSVSEAWSGNRYYDDSAATNQSWFTIGSSTLPIDQWAAQVEPALLSARVNDLDPDRTAATYNATLGGSASLSAFLSEARKQSSSN